MRAVAFFRNLNLGHPRAPGRDQLVAAFEGAGATGVVSYRTNGTVVFDSPAPARTGQEVVSALGRVCGYADIAVVRRERWLRDLVERLDGLAEAADSAEVTFFDARGAFPEALPWRPPRGGLTVVAADDRHAVCVNDLPATSFGTPVIERLLGVRATSRSTGTVRGVVERL